MSKWLASGVPALALVIVAMAVGGLPWACISLVGFLAFIAFGANLRDVLMLIWPAMFWLAVFHFTCDRRMFFPFSILFAASLALRANWATALEIMVLFLMARILQDATLKVLAVELIVAVVALCPIYFARKKLSPLWEWHGAFAVATSLLAFIGLIF